MEEYKTDAEIYAVLEREIIDLTLRPGSSLSENPLCARFGAPRSMIRVVLQRLQENGLVKIVPYKVTTVTRLNREIVDELIYERTAVEARVLRDFSPKCTPEQGRIDPISVLLEPLVEIALSLGLGALAGLLLNQLEIYFHSRSKRMSLSVAFVLLTVGLSMVSFEVGPIHCSFSLLLVCMMTGTVFCNICPTSDELMDRLDRWVSPVNILFFVLSGAELDLNILANPMVLLIGAVYIASRSLGKISGSYVSCKATRCSEKIQKYLGITLLPQAGVALGMAAEAAELSDGHMVRNVVLFSVLVYELVGPTLAKLSLTAAGEIIPEGRTSARTTNKPEEPVSVD